MKKIKVLFIIDSLASGGAQRQLATVVRLLKIEGLYPEVLCYVKDDFFASVLEEELIPIHWLIEDGYLKRILRIRKFIRKGGYDTVISFLDVPNFINNISAIGGKRWKVITGERSSKEEFFLTRKGKLFAWFQRYSDNIVCNSNNAKNMWHKHYPQYANKLTTIYNTVALSEITSNYVPRSNGKLKIVVAASYQYLKNPVGLIQALVLMNEEQRSRVCVDWYGRIEVTSGNTSAYDESISLVKDLNLNKSINLYDATKDISNKMNEADIVALFSSVEGLPNTICEGMTIGKPIIMSKVSDYSVLIDSSNGFLCDWDNVESIKQALLSAINLSDQELLAMGSKSKEKADKLFSKGTIVSQWIELL